MLPTGWMIVRFSRCKSMLYAKQTSKRWNGLQRQRSILIKLLRKEAIVTSEEEIAGFNIVRAIGSKVVDPRRIVIRDAKSYCAVLLDDNNRKPIVRLHFNSPTSRHVGTFVGKEE